MDRGNLPEAAWLLKLEAGIQARLGRTASEKAAPSPRSANSDAVFSSALAYRFFRGKSHLPGQLSTSREAVPGLFPLGKMSWTIGPGRGRAAKITRRHAGLLSGSPFHAPLDSLRVSRARGGVHADRGLGRDPGPLRRGAESVRSS